MVETCVLGVRIRRRSRLQAVDEIRRLLAGEKARSVYFVHAASANQAFEDPAFRETLNRGDLVLNDGIGVRLAARAQGLELEENLVGTDLVPVLLAEDRERPLRVYLLGGGPGVAGEAARCVREHYPGVEVAGWADGFFEIQDEPVVVERINRSRPHLLLVGMGSPRQERFIDRHLGRVDCRVAMAVGGLFDHFAGRLRRAPPLVRRLGLEWAQLLCQQPHKWRRYLLGNPKFLWRVYGPRPAQLAQRSAVVALSLAAALAAAEFMVRHARPQILERYPEGLYLPSPTRQYRLRPHFRGQFRYPEFSTEVRISGQGLREDREYGAPGPGLRRLLAAGDSFTMGYSVEASETWVKRLEGLLGPGFEVINAGTPGYSTRQELAYLEEEGLALGPEIVLLGFFLGNDLRDNARPLLPVELRDGRLLAAGLDAGAVPLAFRLALARHSHLFHLAWRSRRAGGPEPVPETGWQATAELLERMAESCRARGGRLIVVLIPEREQDPRVPRRLEELCRRAGLEVVDLTARMPDRAALYFPQDGHWNRRGNQVAARTLYEYLAP